jgi:hypothetical protein
MLLGVRKCLEPSICDWNSTPSSVTFRRTARLKTWKPPESVSMGLSQFMNLCRPPAFLIISVPGLRYKWYAFDSSIWTPQPFNSSLERVFTVACVPTGMNAGVSNSPWEVFTLPDLARVDMSFAVISIFIL